MSEFAILDDRARFLIGRGYNYSSQFGEDGLIEAVFLRIGILNRWCFEVGATDGEFLSNTKRLRDDGWNAVLIEGDERHYRKLEERRSERVRTVREWIEPESLDRILAERGEKGQAGLLPIRELGAEKGYVALCHTFCNVLFCARSEWERSLLN